ncbi:diguanylate cyclase [Sneathiella sp. CAU 1612]|uniref:diguanylate cyclase n=1 Tax=Sneathiella sedimenti TaxID=2816034 RepID=A0ABS3F8Q5_9PROT|nr:diguanylate cyclase [Sneathiella sedimenti]MBO0334900.1 diguanylate cyclase [Sneathiella sedimenti]
MRYAANLLVVSDSPANKIEPCLVEAGYRCTRLSFLQMFEEDFGDQSFDLILIDGENNTAHVNVKDIARMAIEHALPTLLIGPADIKCRIQTISPGYCDLELLSRVASLVRLENMEQELARRIATTETYGVDLSTVTSPEPDIGEANILIVGNKTVVLGNILLRLDTKTNIHICKNPELALEDLRSREFDAVILSGVGLGDANLRLCNDIRADTRLYNLPVLMVLENTENRRAAFVHGVSDIIFHETEMDALINRVGLQIQQYRYRFAIQNLFRLAKQHPVADGPSDLYSSGFMRTHLPVMFKEHAAQHKVLSVATIKIDNLDKVKEKYGYPPSDQLLRQVGSALSNLVRGEDFCSHLDTGHFLIALPGTRKVEALIALKRVEGVLRSTEFALSYVPKSVQVETSVGLAEVQPNDTIEDVVERGLSQGMGDEKAA